MNKYMAILHTFCDACFNQKTCKGNCKRMQDMEKFVHKYDKLARAFDEVCNDIAHDEEKFTKEEIISGDAPNKEEIKEMYLNGRYSK